MPKNLAYLSIFQTFKTMLNVLEGYLVSLSFGLSNAYFCPVGLMPDTKDPDTDDAQNTGFKERQQFYVSDSKNAKIVVLSGYLMSNIRGLNLPIPSDCKVTVRLTRNLDELLVTQTPRKVNSHFRISIKDIELQVPR